MVNILKFCTPKGKYSKILHTKVSNKMAYANSENPDQNALISVSAVCHSTKNFQKQLHKQQNLGKKKYGIKC